MRQRLFRQIGLILLITGLTASITRAQTVTNVNSRFYYEIGGGKAVASYGQESFDLDASVYAGLSYSCGDFDFDENVKALFESYADQLEDLYDKLLQAISGAVAQLPAYLLQRANLLSKNPSITYVIKTY